MNLDKNQLEKKTNELARDLGIVKLGNLLAGGVVSDVYSAILTANGKDKKIVVKYTKSEIGISEIFSKTDIVNMLSDARAGHNLDVLLQESLSVPTPNIVAHFPAENITLMEDFTADGFKLLQNCLLEKEMPKNLAKKFGETVALLRNELKKETDNFEQVEPTQNQFEERFFELKVLLYNGRMNIFNQIEANFIAQDSEQLSWTDGDQKNFAIKQNGEIMAFDFGRSIKCDPDFMLPNLLGHLGLFIIAGYLEDGVDFLQLCRESFEAKFGEFEKAYSMDEQKFVEYFTASLLHRGMAMRWIDPRIADIVGQDSLKHACLHFGDLIFEKGNRIVKIKDAFSLLSKVAILAKKGRYKQEKITL